jgi:lysosomal acid lipase/cholesteryl ester hydrolase
MKRRIPLFTLTGVPDADVSTHPFTTEDGLGLSMLRFQRSGGSSGSGGGARGGRGGGHDDDVVLIVHGLTTSSDMFIMPEHKNLVTFLLDSGFRDVWTLDYRMSNRFPYNRAMHRYNMDQIALYDFPAALHTLREVIGQRRVHVIAHCLGSVSFLMSLFGGAVDGITSVVANSAGLTPRVPAWSRVKLNVAPTFVEWVLGFEYLDPSWEQEPALSRGWTFAKLVDLFHPECDVSACHMLSLMWGTGWPALYRHENLHPVTHERGGDLYGATGMHYYRHVLKMVNAGRAVKYDPSDPAMAALPDDYLSGAAEITTPVLLTTGDTNRVFADSNIECWKRLESVAPGRHELEVIPGYGHQDVFMGKNVAYDVFPRMLDFIKRQAV